MHICLVIDAKLPVHGYGGTERVVFCLGRALHDLGHKVTFIAQPAKLDFADVIPIDLSRSIESQLPLGVDIVHLHGGFAMPETVPACQTIHGNCREETTFHPNSIFVSKSHAMNHGAHTFVHNGLDPRDYPAIDLSANRDSFVFLAKAAWRVKNLKGAIQVSHHADAHLEVLGGHRLNFKMGFRFTLSPNIHFHGIVGDQEKAFYLNRARGLIFPVLWPEPFGVALIEALYFGVPIFGTPYGSLPEIVSTEVAVLSDSARTLGEAAKDWTRFDRRAIHDYWRNRFTAEIMARKYLDYYTSILDGQNLHEAPIHSPPVRVSKMMPWIN